MKEHEKLRKYSLVFALILLFALAVGSTMMFSGAKFTDVESSTGNVLNAGTLDLTINGGNANVKILDLSNMTPGNQPNTGWVLRNAGTTAGILSVSNLSVVETGGTYVDPEGEAGDPDNAGNLGQVLNIRLFADNNKDGWISAGETVLYNGKIADMPSSFSLGRLNAGNDLRLGVIIDWWDTADDNKAQGDTLTINGTFLLQQG